MGELLLNNKVFSEQFQYFFSGKKSFSILKAIKMISDEQYHSRDNKKTEEYHFGRKNNCVFLRQKNRILSLLHDKELGSI
jgi:hypothetical protein